MAKLEALRVGIGIKSGCFGRLDGRIVSVPGLRRKQFRIREILVPEGVYYRTILRAYRCHFLLVVTRGGGYFFVHLDRNTFVAGRRGSKLPWRLRIGYAGFKGGRFVQPDRREWTARRTPSVAEVKKVMAELLGALSEKRLTRWLANTTPASWPERAVLG